MFQQGAAEHLQKDRRSHWLEVGPSQEEQALKPEKQFQGKVAGQDQYPHSFGFI